MAWPVSDDFNRALVGSHTMVVRVEAHANAGDITPSPYRSGGLPIIEGGTVTVDCGSQIRRTLNLTIADPGLTPQDIQDLLTPYGTELWVWRGIRYPNGTAELVPLGRFLVDSATPSSPGGVAGPTGVDIAASDYSRGVVEGRFFIPTKTVKTNVVDEIQVLTDSVMPSTAGPFTDLTNNGTALKKQVYDDGDRAGAVAKLATSINAEYFIDPVGTPTLRTMKNPSSTLADWTVNAGDGGVMLRADTAIDRANIFNGLIVTGQRTDGTEAGWGIATDDDPASATQWGGPFGKKVTTFSSPNVSTTIDCHALAAVLLDRYTAAGWTVALTTLVNPALDGGDVLRINLPDGRIQRHLVDKIVVPLDLTTPMVVNTRSNDPGTDAGTAVPGG